MHIDSLFRFPVKGLSAEKLARVSLAAGYGFPSDRAYAVTDGSLDFDPDQPVFAPKTQFLMLAKYERLAQLQTRFEDDVSTLSVDYPGAPPRTFRLDSAAGREGLADFLADFIDQPLPGEPKLVSAPGHQFTDVSVHGIALMRSISLINLASVRDLSARLGVELNPVRFRGNLLFDGAGPWSELEWVGKYLRAGSVLMKVVRRTKRCAATSVNPATGIRDINLPLRIREQVGHGDFGIYAEVLQDGMLEPDMKLELCEVP